MCWRTGLTCPILSHFSWYQSVRTHLVAGTFDLRTVLEQVRGACTYALSQLATACGMACLFAREQGVDALLLTMDFLRWPVRSPSEGCPTEGQFPP
jgi:hypothetical protein